jgi:hypothetical protein
VYLCVEINKNCLISADLKLTSRPGLMGRQASSRGKRRHTLLESDVIPKPRQVVPGLAEARVRQSPKESVTRGCLAMQMKPILVHLKQGCKKICCIIKIDQIKRKSNEIMRIHCFQCKLHQWHRQPDLRASHVPRQSCARYARSSAHLDQPHRYKSS